jgi:hypothetical protein
MGDTDDEDSINEPDESLLAERVGECRQTRQCGSRDRAYDARIALPL